MTVGEWKKIKAYFDADGAAPAGGLPEGWENLPVDGE